MSKSEDAESDCGKRSIHLSKDLLNIHSDGVPAALRLKKKNNIDSLQDGTKQKTFKFQPSSALLRAKDFLPQMATANASLEERLKTEPQSAIDIENTDGFSGPVIEMNMALVEAGSSSDSESDLEDSEDSSCDDSCDDSSNPALLGEVTEHNMRLTKDTGKTDHRPKIEVLDTCNTRPQTVSNTNETNSPQMCISGSEIQDRTEQEDNT